MASCSNSERPSKTSSSISLISLVFSLYLWFTSPIDSQGKYVPCELLGDTSTHDDLMFYAEQAGARRVGREFA